MLIVSHPTGNANVRAVLRSLHSRRRLQRFYTTLGLGQPSRNLAWLPKPVREELQRREYPIPRELLVTRPGLELGRHARTLLARTKLVRRPGQEYVDHVYRDLDSHVARRLPREQRAGELSAVYAYEDGALETFRVARKIGLRCIYDLPIGYGDYARRLFAEERELMPEFAPTFEEARTPPAKLARKQEEAQLADTIVACSDFVQQTLLDSGIPPAKIRVVQFGSPEGGPEKQWTREDERGPLRVLYAGLITQRKGIGYLLQAVQQLNRPDLELLVLGRLPPTSAPLAPYREHFRYEATRPHRQVLELMASCHVLVLPSLFEGQALVILEAMRCGLPVIVTPNTGAASLVQEGQEGFVVPIRSTTALREKLEWCATHRAALPTMGEAARRRAQACTWESYEGQIAALVGCGQPPVPAAFS